MYGEQREIIMKRKTKVEKKKSQRQHFGISPSSGCICLLTLPLVLKCVDLSPGDYTVQVALSTPASLFLSRCSQEGATGKVEILSEKNNEQKSVLTGT